MGTLETGDLWVDVVDDRKVVVALREEHDLSTSERLREVIEAQIENNDVVIVDLTQVAFIDSNVIHALLAAHRAAQDANVQLRLVLRSDSIVSRALEISGASELVECRENRDEALVQLSV